MLHVRGSRSRLDRLAMAYTVLGATRRWTTVVLDAPARSDLEPLAAEVLAPRLRTTLAWLDVAAQRTTAVFVASDGWRAELRVEHEGAPPVDHELLEALVRRRMLTTIQRVRLAAKLRARAPARAAWLAAGGFEQLVGWPTRREPMPPAELDAA